MFCVDSTSTWKTSARHSGFGMWRTALKLAHSKKETRKLIFVPLEGNLTAGLFFLDLQAFKILLVFV